MATEDYTINGIGCLCTLIFIALLILKIANAIAWSWLLVFAPLWIPITIAISMWVIAYMRYFYDKTVK